MRIKLNQFFHVGKLKAWLNLNSGIRYDKGYVKTEGAYDLCGDAIHRVLFLDYDKFKFKKEWLFRQLRSLQEMYRIGNFYVFQTDETSFHAVCFDKFKTIEINQIVASTSCDDAFLQNWRYDYTPRVLRLTEKGTKGKPKLIKTIASRHSSERDKSYAHIRFYENLIPEFNPRIDDVEYADRTNGMWAIQYDTKSPELKKEMENDEK